MLRTTSLENYDAWVAGTLPFASPEVKNAIETWSEIWFNPDYVFGGTDAIVSTYVQRLPGAHVRGPAQVLAPPPGQLYHRLLPRRAPKPASTMTSSTCPRWATTMAGPSSSPVT